MVELRTTGRDVGGVEVLKADDELSSIVIAVWKDDVPDRGSPALMTPSKGCGIGR